MVILFSAFQVSEGKNLIPKDLAMNNSFGLSYDEWNKTFGGARMDVAHSVQQTKDGGYIVAGITESFGRGNDDAWLIKTDEDGNEELNETFGGNKYDALYSVQQTKDGNYIAAGVTESFGRGDDAWLIKAKIPISIDFSGGFGIKIKFKNLMNRGLSNLEYSISLNGYFINSHSFNGIVTSLSPGNKFSIRIIPFGIGYITAVARIDGVSKIFHFLLLGVFTLIV